MQPAHERPAFEGEIYRPQATQCSKDLNTRDPGVPDSNDFHRLFVHPLEGCWGMMFVTFQMVYQRYGEECEGCRVRT